MPNTTTALAIETKERPILFSGPMVKAIREGRKTQTRRVMKPPLTVNGVRHHKWERPDVIERCPYGKVGDRLWVRETWQTYRARSAEQNAAIKASIARIESGQSKDIVAEVGSWPMPPNGDVNTLYAADFGEWAYDVDSDLKPWRPSIFMPRKLSRITLEITEVRVERLRAITGGDAWEEGFRARDDVGTYYHSKERIERFAEGWDEINAKRGYSWDDNPWVWAITFKTVKES